MGMPRVRPSSPVAVGQGGGNAGRDLDVLRNVQVRFAADFGADRRAGLGGRVGRGFAMIGCMGGWCGQREKCAHYHAGGQNPAERLCGEREEPEIMRHDSSDASVLWVAMHAAMTEDAGHLGGGVRP